MVLPLPLSDRNLILTGYTGPNQPRVGQDIAARLKMPFANIETQISERFGMSVDDIRIYYGETRLKSIEAEIIDETCLRRATVIRVSAHTLLNGDTLARLNQTGPIICMVTTLDAMLQRLHMVMGARYYNPEERAVELGKLKREWAARGLPEVHEIDTTYLEIDAVVDKIIKLWQDIAIVRA